MTQEHPHHHDHDHDHDHDRWHAHGGAEACDHHHGQSLRPPHHHGHSHAPARYDNAFAVGVALNLGFVVIEVVYGLSAQSLSLIADAGHNLSDVFGLLLAWAAAWVTKRKPTSRWTYGFGRSTILASLTNAVVLLVAVGAIAWEAVRRFSAPEAVAEGTVLWVAACGIVINTGTALMFMRGSRHDLNIRGAFLHMAVDAGVSLGVVIAALLMERTGWLWLDPAVSLVIVVVITLGTWGLLRDSFTLALDAVPVHIDHEEVAAFLASQPGVTAVHDLHIWPLSTTSVALTAHLVGFESADDDDLYGLSDMLSEKFGIGHTTIQVERGRGSRACQLAPSHIV